MRKVIQIVATSRSVGNISISNLVVLCDDGLIFEYSPSRKKQWNIFPPVPQGDTSSLDEVNSMKDREQEDIDRYPVGSN